MPSEITYFPFMLIFFPSMIMLPLRFFIHHTNALMITAAQLRAARALLDIDQKTMAAMAGISVPTIQRMEASAGNVRGVIDSLTKVVEALDRAGVELIGEHAVSGGGGRGVRLKHPVNTG